MDGFSRFVLLKMKMKKMTMNKSGNALIFLIFFKKTLDKQIFVWYNKDRKEREVTKMYIVKRFDLVDFCWKYMNSYNSFSEAREAREMMENTYPGKYEIFPKED